MLRIVPLSQPIGPDSTTIYVDLGNGSSFYFNFTAYESYLFVNVDLNHRSGPTHLGNVDHQTLLMTGRG